MAQGDRRGDAGHRGDSGAVSCVGEEVHERAGPERQSRVLEAVAVPEDEKPSTSSPGGLPSSLAEQWGKLPARARLVFAMGVCFVICNMDKVNISVAIIPMAKEFGWSPTVAGLIQSSFFWGYMASQLPGGFAVNRLSGRRVLPAGVAVWSAATAAVPLCSSTINLLCLSRAFVGVGEAVAPSSVTDVVAKAVPPAERGRAMSFVFAGLQVGSITGLIVAPELIKALGWQSVFYLFGFTGLVWVLWWEYLVKGIREEGGDDNPVAVLEKPKEGPGSIPWRAFVRCPPLRALAITHFSNNWFHYSMLAWLPTYFSDTLHLELSQAAQVSLIPPITAIVTSAVAGSSADKLLEIGWPVGRVRKAAQTMAFMGPSACLLASLGTDDPMTTVALISVAIGLNSFSLAGLYCNHQDLSPRYASILLGMTNTVASIPGVIGVAAAGIILDQTHSWELSLFVPSIACFVMGTAAFTLFGSAQGVDFDDAEPNRPFEFERKLVDRFPALGTWLARPFTGAPPGERKDEDVMPMH